MAMGMDLDVIGRPGPAGQAMRMMDPGMDMYMPMANFWPVFVMWVVMMAAMMLPTLVPTLRSYEDLIANANGTRAGWLGVVAGYFVVWVGFAGLIAGAQIFLLHRGVLDMLGIPTSGWIAAGLLAVVGAYQFTWAKEVCHGVCHSPMMYFLGHWRTGALGGLRMGAGLGLYCCGCCWGFMALGFVGGTMSLLWMGLATLIMVFEKLPQVAHRVTKPVGIALLIGAGIVAAKTAGILG
ncbi:DUF2182 domain-containing protein [Alphaproteobacteria bacterium KMM 3653]|uniref:DUF2182 domain-containing protein n=2 Tax=Harenicola maris TaxID=2841044 RepID=A0AAP2CLH3_9RHOB|nr:DUF2182 domain-containing protein [Harenicola maris]